MNAFYCTFLRHLFAAPSCTTFLHYLLAALSCGTAAPPCGTFLRHLLALPSCGTVLRHHLAVPSCGTFLRHLRPARSHHRRYITTRCAMAVSSVVDSPLCENDVQMISRYSRSITAAGFDNSGCITTATLNSAFVMRCGRRRQLSRNKALKQKNEAPNMLRPPY